MCKHKVSRNGLCIRTTVLIDIQWFGLNNLKSLPPRSTQASLWFKDLDIILKGGLDLGYQLGILENIKEKMFFFIVSGLSGENCFWSQYLETVSSAMCSQDITQSVISVSIDIWSSVPWRFKIKKHKTYQCS